MTSAVASPETRPLEAPAVIPIATMKMPQVRLKRGQMTFLTPVETLAVLLADRHGLRASEVCRLKLADIDLKGGSISIRRLKGSLQTVQPLFQHPGQPLLDEMLAIRNWLRNRPADGSNYLFHKPEGWQARPYPIFSGVPDNCPVCWACSGHSLASHLVAGNVNLALIRQALGHRSINSTMQYVGTSDGQAAVAAQAALMNLY